MKSEEHQLDYYLSVGEKVIFNPEPNRKDGPRHRSALRGWEFESFVLLDTPFDGGLPIAFHRDQPCVVRFVSQGAACGFDSKVLDWSSTRQPYFRVAWPEKFQAIQVRKHDRAEVDVYCRITQTDATQFEGQVLDISVGGCRISADHPFPAGSLLQISFMLPDGILIEEATCLVRAATPERGRYVHGCRFENLSEMIQNEIDYFVRTMLAGIRAKEKKECRILIVEPKPENVSAVVQVLEGNHYTVLLASSAVDAFHRLRIASPQAVLINCVQTDLDGLKMCQIIRAARGLEKLPMFMYGENHAIPQADILACGASGFFSTLAASETVLSELAKYCPNSEFAPLSPESTT